MSAGEREFHRKTAAHCFNMTWDYLEKKRRNTQDDEMMLNLAHSSRYHWGLVGSPRDLLVGDWQISRVYAALGQPLLSLQFAKSSLRTCRRDGLVELLPTVYEAMARAYAASKDYKTARRYVNRARTQLGISALDDEDKRIYLDQIRQTEKMIRN